MEVSVQEAKTQLSKLLRWVEAGETITIRRGRKPVAVLSKVKPEPDQRKIWGELDIEMGGDFDEIPEGFEPYA